MAKGVAMRLDDLKIKCEALGLSPVPTRNRVNKETGERYKDFSKDDCIRALQEYYIGIKKERGEYHKSLDWILRLDSPMLALQIKNLPEETQEEVKSNKEKWLAEEKVDGCRLLLAWFKEDGTLDAYSRNNSVIDFLPSYYGDKLYDNVNIDDLSSFPDFIIDGELVLSNKTVDKGNGEIIADTQQSMVSAMLSADYDLSKAFQEFNPIKYIAYDIIMYDGIDLTDKPLYERLKYLDLVFNKIKPLINIERVKSANGLDTMEFYNQIVSVGGEGLVVKDLDSKYDTKGKRAGEWVKIKRTVSGSLLEAKYGDTIDTFVVGFHRGNGKNQNLVGSLIFGIYLLDENNKVILDDRGAPYIHEIAIIGGMEDALREAITIYNPVTDEVTLRQDVYFKVAEIDGQDISSKQKRFSHAVLKSWRMDKSPEQCMIQKDLLDRLVL